MTQDTGAEAPDPPTSLDLTDEDFGPARFDVSRRSAVDFTGPSSLDGGGETDFGPPFTTTPFREIPYDPGEDREQMRGVIALILLGVLTIVVIGAFASLWTQWLDRLEVDTLLTHLLAPIVGLVGAVTGFYYGSHSEQRPQSPGGSRSGQSGQQSGASTQERS